MKKDLLNREDVHILVSTFYGRIRKDVYLAPIFEKHIDDWEQHFEHLTNFWEANLFFGKNFKGNPLRKHLTVDAAEDYSINEQHFGVWLNHWIQTLDDLYEGENATMAKNRARKIGTFLHVHMFQAKPRS